MLRSLLFLLSITFFSLFGSESSTTFSSLTQIRSSKKENNHANTSIKTGIKVKTGIAYLDVTIDPLGKVKSIMWGRSRDMDPKLITDDVKNSLLQGQLKAIHRVALKHISDFQALLRKTNLTKVPKSEVRETPSIKVESADLFQFFLMHKTNASTDCRGSQTTIDVKTKLYNEKLNNIERSYKTALCDSTSISSGIIFSVKAGTIIGSSYEYAGNLLHGDLEGYWYAHIHNVHKHVILNLQKVQDEVARENGVTLGNIDLVQTYLTSDVDSKDDSSTPLRFAQS